MESSDSVCVSFFFFPGYRTVDALLQRMFEADLDPNDFADNEDCDNPNNGNFSNPAFSSV